mmetsp:Transcript_11060/g.34233  ORF Transcript_11060/g.34233 Transcript_11060/m.34233 type:complete len:261 (+) Transcript_11060:89-871(+)
MWVTQMVFPTKQRSGSLTRLKRVCKRHVPEIPRVGRMPTPGAIDEGREPGCVGLPDYAAVGSTCFGDAPAAAAACSSSSSSYSYSASASSSSTKRSAFSCHRSQPRRPLPPASFALRTRAFSASSRSLIFFWRHARKVSSVTGVRSVRPLSAARSSSSWSSRRWSSACTSSKSSAVHRYSPSGPSTGSPPAAAFSASRRFFSASASAFFLSSATLNRRAISASYAALAALALFFSSCAFILACCSRLPDLTLCSTIWVYF